jgi:hypothetical protein
MDDKDLDCGGRAPVLRSSTAEGGQRRHRFPYGRLHPKAAWRFASRRSPKSMVAAQAALGLSAYSGVAATRLYAVSIPHPPQYLATEDGSVIKEKALRLSAFSASPARVSTELR